MMTVRKRTDSDSDNCFRDRVLSMSCPGLRTGRTPDRRPTGSRITHDGRTRRYFAVRTNIDFLFFSRFLQKSRYFVFDSALMMLLFCES